MLYSEAPSEEVVARAERIILECIDAGYSQKDFELLIICLQRYKLEVEQAALASPLPSVECFLGGP